MPLTQTQINQLNALAGRTNLTATDRANLDYAQRTYGYQLPTSSGSNTPNTPTGSVAINGAQYNTTALQQANFSNIYQQGNTLYGTPLNQNINSNTIQTGSQYGNIGSQLPNNSATQSAIDIYTNSAFQNGTQSLQELQNQYNTLSAQQLQQTQQGIQNTQGELNTLEQNRQNDIDKYRSITDPLYQQGADEYKRMLDSTKQIDYTALVKQRLELTNDIVNYSKLMRDELDVEAGRPALQSVSNGRQTAIQQNYLSKISTAQAATAAIDGNFNLAFDIMDRGATVIQNITADRINFLNFVSGIYDDKIDDRRGKLLNLTADEKEQIDQLRGTLQKQIETVEANKAIVQNLMSDPTTAMIAHKAGLSLTDSADVIAEKLNKYYVANPTLIPESIVDLQQKYPDAGINFWDSPDVIKTKLSKSAVFKQENGSTISSKELLDQAQSLVNSGQATSLSDAISQIQSATGSNLGDQVGTIQGLPSYATRAANPGMTRANRNNNPGNIKVSSYSKGFDGVIGVESDSAADGGNFLIFDSAESGIAAIGRLLKEGKSYQGVTAEQAIKKYNGNGGYGAADVGLNPNQNFQAQLNSQEKIMAVATAIAKAEGFKGTITPSSNNSSVDSWVKLIQSGAAKIETITDKDLRNKVVEAMAKDGNISQADATTTNIINDKIKLIDDIKNSVAGANAVGPNALARFSLSSWATGKKQEFIGKVEQLISQGTLDALLNLKKAGGTLGALSDQERIMLQNAASKIGAWTIRDSSGRVKGYKVSERAFKAELDNLKTLAERALQNAGGQTGIVNTLEQYLSSNPQRVTDYNNLISIYPNLSDDEILQVLGN
jgi:hypothetical protein